MVQFYQLDEKAYQPFKAIFNNPSPKINRNQTTPIQTKNDLIDVSSDRISEEDFGNLIRLVRHKKN
jgi:hypothetical protein